MNKTGFLPIIGYDPKILILGSMPSEISLQQCQYYAHPRNAFWYIMGSLFDFSSTAPYSERARLLVKHKIALWDVLQECEREGSLDASIIGSSIKVNDFPGLLASYPSIQLVVFNGFTAEKEYRKRVLPGLNRRFKLIQMIRLPSTSPAMATLNRDQKLAAWSACRVAEL